MSEAGEPCSVCGEPLPVVQRRLNLVPNCRGCAEHIRRTALDLHERMKSDPALECLALAFVPEATRTWERDEENEPWGLYGWVGPGELVGITRYEQQVPCVVDLFKRPSRSDAMGTLTPETWGWIGEQHAGVSVALELGDKW